MTRRQMMKSVGIGAAAVALRCVDAADPVPPVKALVFDTFGTVVDWRGSIIEEGKAWEKTKGITIDWAHFADRWRAGYGPSMDKVRRGEMPWTNLDHLHRALLEDLARFRRRSHAPEEKVHYRAAFERKRGAACRHGQARWYSLGPDSLRRV